MCSEIAVSVLYAAVAASVMYHDGRSCLVIDMPPNRPLRRLLRLHTSGIKK